MVIKARTNSVVIALTRNGWLQALERMPQAMLPVEWWPATDGRRVAVPDWWGWTPGAWGCCDSHMRVWAWGLERDVDAVFVFEEDVVFSSDFADGWQRFIDRVPSDWQQLYLGGQHLQAPTPMIDGVVRGTSIGRTHAYVLSRAGMRIAQRTVCREVRSGVTQSMRRQGQIDYALARMHERGDLIAYCPERWLCGQQAGVSSVYGGEVAERWWQQ